MLKNFFGTVIFLLLVVASLVSSAPQKKPSTTVSKLSVQDRISVIIKGLSNNNVTANDAGGIIGALGDLSPQCQATLLTIVVSRAFQQCVPISAALPLVPILADPTLVQKLTTDPKTELKQIQPYILQFSDGICAAPKCADNDVEAAFKLIQDGCKADLSNKFIEAVSAGIAFYSPARDSMCFKDDQNNFCLFKDDIDYVVNLKKSPIVMIGGLLDDVAASNTADVCTKCNQEIFNAGFNYIDGQSDLGVIAKGILKSKGVGDRALGAGKFAVALKCGVEFEDGKVGGSHTATPSSPIHPLKT